jgi:hypothetical protein
VVAAWGVAIGLPFLAVVTLSDGLAYCLMLEWKWQKAFRDAFLSNLGGLSALACAFAALDVFIGHSPAGYAVLPLALLGMTAAELAALFALGRHRPELRQAIGVALVTNVIVWVPLAAGLSLVASFMSVAL